LLDNVDLLNVPSIAFCPAEVDPWFLYNTSVNPWMNGYSFIGYGTRPNSDWESFVPSPEMSKLTKLGPHTAILADTFPLWSALATRHGDGVNVCYSDGSVNYVAANPTLLPLHSLIPYDYDNPYSPDVPNLSVNNGCFLNLAVTPNTGIWATFDGL